MRYIFVIICLFSFGVVLGQDTLSLTLDDCIKLALERNLALRRTTNNQYIAESNKKAALLSFLPDLEAGVNSDYTKGTFFDQSAFRQVSTTTNTSNPFLRSGVNLFNGFANQYSLKSSQSSLLASQYATKAQSNTVKENVLVNYMNVLLGIENLKIAIQRIELLEAQLEREVKRESVGVGNLESVYNFKSQVANEKLSKIRIENQLKTDQLVLVQSLQLDIDGQYEFKGLDSLDHINIMSNGAYEDILAEAVSFSPIIKEAQALQDASLFDYKASKGRRLPTISAFAQYGSRYSSNGARSPDSGEISENSPFFEQMDWNAYSFFNFSLNVPIFTRYQNANNVQIARINLNNAEIAEKEARLNTTNTIQRVYLELVTSQSTYSAAIENAEALEQSFSFVKRRYETGNTDFYTYLEALNNKNRGDIELINSKISIVFRKKVLDIYRGLD